MNATASANPQHTPRRCPQCGTGLFDEILGGHCPACLVNVARDNGATGSGANRIRFFGDYEIVEEIGRGGMGVVFKARQLSLQRTVALKLIAAEHLESPRAVERFYAEAGAAANLDHPHIVPIYDTGECDGRHYFTMKLIEGKSLAEEIGGPGPAPRNGKQESMVDSSIGKSSSAVAGLVAKVASAVYHAHQHGILHRDLKPANILLDAEGEPHVADFGLAKQIETNGSLTRSGEVLGTPAYMAPEQASGKAGKTTTASDVYGLGVILYEVLAGRPPFRGDSAVATLHAVVHQNPAAPRSINPAASRDLETICLKCLEKEPSRRYASAQELVDELNRFVQGEPIKARAASIPEKLWRWSRRRPALAASLLLLILALALGASGIFWQWRRAEQHAETAKTEAAKNREIATFFEEMLDGVGPAVARGRDTKMLREILDKTAARLGEDLKNQPAVESELRRVIGKVYNDLGEYAIAEEMHRKSLALERERHCKEHPDIVISLTNLACDLRIQGKLTEAEAMHREALAMGRRVLGHEHLEVATSLNDLGCALQDQGKLEEAAALHREALEMQKRLLGAESPEAATTLTNLANVLQLQNDPAGAEPMFREAIAMHGKVSGEDHPRVALALNNLSHALTAQGKLDEAESTSRESLALYIKLMGNENVEVVGTMNGLAGVVDKKGRHGEAEQILREALAIQRKLPGSGNKNLINVLSGLGVTLSSQGKSGDAEPFLREVVEIDRKTLKGDDPMLAGALRHLASCLVEQQKYSEAETLYKEALAISKKALGDADPKRVPTLVKLVGVLEKQGMLAKAEPLYREILSSTNELMGSDNPLVAGLRTKLAASLEMQGKYTEAEPLLREAFEKSGPPGTASETAGYKLAQNLYRQGKFREGETLFRDVFKSRRARLPADSEEVLLTVANLGTLLADWTLSEGGTNLKILDPKPETVERALEAERLLRETLAIRLGGANASQWRTGGVQTRLGGALLAVAVARPGAAGESREALFTEAERLLQKGNGAVQISREIDRIYRRDALLRLVSLYVAWEKPDKAAEWQRKLEEFDKAGADTSTETTRGPSGR